MTISPDAVRAYEQELLQKADMLALGLKGLKSAAPEHAAAPLEENSARPAGGEGGGCAGRGARGGGGRGGGPRAGGPRAPGAAPPRPGRGGGARRRRRRH